MGKLETDFAKHGSNLAAAAAASAEEAVGITVFDGNQERVSAILSALVAWTKTL